MLLLGFKASFEAHWLHCGRPYLLHSWQASPVYILLPFNIQIRATLQGQQRSAAPPEAGGWPCRHHPSGAEMTKQEAGEEKYCTVQVALNNFQHCPSACTKDLCSLRSNNMVWQSQPPDCSLSEQEGGVVTVPLEWKTIPAVLVLLCFLSFWYGGLYESDLDPRMLGYARSTYWCIGECRI